MSASELAEAVKIAYRGILHDPIINVNISDYQKPRFTVSGQVAKPGQYELRADITITEALAVAGGMTTQTAKSQVFLLHRTSKEWYQVQKVDIGAIQKGKDMKADVFLKPNDMIFVPEKFISNFRKYVPYGAAIGAYLSASTSAVTF